MLRGQEIHGAVKREISHRIVATRCGDCVFDLLERQACRHALHVGADGVHISPHAQLVDFLASDQVAQIADQFASHQASAGRCCWRPYGKDDPINCDRLADR